jgi:UDP-glucose 4-epimerase
MVKKANAILGWEAELSLEDSVVDAWNWEKSLKNLNVKS